VSIVAVAKAAGVSPSTVARVINRHPAVTLETSNRVRRAMDEMDYQPPPAARRRGPRTQKNQGFRTRNIAKLLVAMDDAHLRSMTAPGAVAEALSRYGLNLIFVPMSNPENLPPIISLRHVDGVIVQGVEPTGLAAELLQKIPAVWMMTRRSETFWADYVQPDNRANGRMAAEHLLRRGCRRLGLINLQPNYPAFRQRSNAFIETARAGGAVVFEPSDETVDPAEVLHPEGLQSLVKEQMAALIDAADKPDGIYLTRPSSIGVVYRELYDRGMEPGRDLEIVLGDYHPDIHLNFNPAPVCIDAQIKGIAERAVDQLIWRIRNPDEPGPVGINMPPRLVLPGDLILE